MRILDTIFEGLPPISHDEAEDAAQDLINHYFKNEPRKGGGVMVSIPPRPDNTDLILMQYIHQQRQADATIAAQKGTGHE